MIMSEVLNGQYVRIIRGPHFGIRILVDRADMRSPLIETSVSHGSGNQLPHGGFPKLGAFFRSLYNKHLDGAKARGRASG